ncbi:MAG: hypothetical protein U0031_20125 [Thermomicrobiales bacterium]
MRKWQALGIVPVAAMLLTGSVMAQEEGDDSGGESRIPAPSECTVEPRAADEVSSVLALDAEGIQAPALITITPPLGEVVDNDTRLAVQTVAREALACFNAGDIARATALMTENGIKRAYWGLTIDQASRDETKSRLSSTPVPRPEDKSVRLLAVTDASTLPDGRVAAFVVINEPLLPPSGPETLLFVFANQDGNWLIDDWVDFSIVPANYGTPEAATPTA